MLRLFAESLLPIFLVAGAGYLVEAGLKLGPRPLAQVAFYLFAPCLVFRVLVDGELPGDALLRMVLFAAASLLSVAALAALAARAMGWPRSLSTAVVLVVLLPNAGNYGLSANLFAFGEAGLAHASVFFVVSASLSFTVGVFVASLGRAGLRSALAGLPRVPAVWAVAAALIMMQTRWRLPLPLDRTVGLLADATIPVLLIVLGMQLRSGRLGGPFLPLAFATGMRLVGGPAVGVVLASLFGLEGAARQAGILESAMPSAVIATVLASQYEVEPTFVTAAVFATTLLSPLTLTPLLAYLGA